MIHQYQLGGHNIVLDICSGSVHVVDEVAYDIIAMVAENKTEAEIISEMLKKYSDITEADVKESLRNSPRHLSMDASLTQDEDNNLYDVLKSESSPMPDRELLRESLQLEISKLMEILNPRSADIIKMYYGIGIKHPLTLEEIAERHDISRERVRQIKEKAIRRLKNSSKSRNLKSYLD